MAAIFRCARGAWQQLRSALQQERANRSLLEQISEEGQEFNELALRNSQRAANLVTHFKESTIDFGNNREETVHPASLLADFAELYTYEFARNGQQLQVDIATDLPDLKLVPEALSEALQRIFGNILDHAFTPGQTGSVRFTASRTG